MEAVPASRNAMMSCMIEELNGGDVSSTRQKESKKDEPEYTFA
jgi:hypothetical protein